jgi:predicted ester cyclase
MAELTADQQANVKALRRMIEEGFSGGRVEVVDEVCTENVIEHQAGMNPPTREGAKRAITFLHRLAPDLKVTIEDLGVDGDRVWIRAIGRGTHTGDVLGAPSGRSFEITVMDVCRFEGGRIAEHWGVADRFSQFEQLGLIPPMGRAATIAR